jgi:PAS domain S-box-containing protein
MAEGERAQDVLARTSGDHLRLLVDAQPDYAIFLLDPDGRVRTWNTGARRMKGYAEEEILGEHFSRFHPPEEVERGHPEEELRIARAEGRFEEEGWRVRKDGTRFWADVVLTPLYDEGQFVGYGKITRDLTARRVAEEELRLANQSLEQFRLLVSSVRDYAIFLLDPEGRVRTWNTGARRIKGYAEEEILGEHFSRFYLPEDVERGHPEDELRIARAEGRFEEEGWRLRKDGSRFWADVLITALRDDDGRLVGFAKVTRDLTERRRTDERLHETATELARTNEQLERFASAAAHDLAEPIRTMTGLADLVARRYGDRLDESARSSLADISAAGRRLRALIDALLAYARAAQRPLAVEPVPLADVLDGVVDGLRASIAEAGAEVHYDRGALPTVVADPPLVASIVQNLVANAVKFGGERPRVDVSAEQEGAQWRVTVSDEGVGIAAADHDRVFGLFERVEGAESAPGVGLGLAMARQLVERQGGRMGVESAPGRGSRFWFTLPALR